MKVGSNNVCLGMNRYVFYKYLKIQMFIIAPPPARIKPSVTLTLMLLLMVIAVDGQLLLTGISITNSTILVSSTYTFSFSRFSMQAIPNSSYLCLTFAGQYGTRVPPAPPCSISGLGSVMPACAFSGNILYVRQLFTTSASLSANSFMLSVSNIINPTPADTYTPLLSVAILTPSAVVFQGSTSNAVVSIASGTAKCTAAISNAFVSKKGQISITYTSSYITSANAANYDLFVSIPTSYPEDLTDTPVDPSLSIKAQLAIYPGVYLFQTAFTTALTITLLMPPSTKPAIDFIDIYTETNEGAIGEIDSCSISISGMQPSNFNSISISKGTVQRSTTMQFDLSLSTSLYPSDTLTIVFPTAFDLAGVPNNVSILGIGTATLTKYDNHLLISSSNISLQAVLNARLIFGIAGITMPFNTLPYTLTLTLGTAGNYSRSVQSYAYSADAGWLNVTASCLNTEIGTILTRCLFSFSTVSRITSNGTISIMFPNDFTILLGSSPCSLTVSGLNSGLECQYSAKQNSITATSITSSPNNILPTAILLNLSVNISQHVGNHSLAVSTQSLGATVDLGYAVLATTTRTLKSAQFSVVSSSTMTNYATNYIAYFSLPFDMGVTYTVLLSLPFPVQNGPSLTLSGGSLVSFTDGVLTFTANQLTNNASFSIGNLLTPSSLQPVTVRVRVMYNSLNYFSGSASLTMTQLRQFSIATLVTSSQVVHAANVATVSLSDLSSGDKIVIGGYAGFYQSSQPNCSSNVVSCGLVGVLTVLNASTPTVFSINIQNLGFVGSYQLNLTSYDSTQSFAKLSSLITLTVTTPNTINIIANQTNPYLNEPSIYTFSLQLNTPNSNSLLVTPSGITVTSATCLLNCGSLSKLPLGYLFTITSTNCIVTFTATNPTAFSSSVKFVFKTSNSQGDIDYGQFVPKAACTSPCRSCSTGNGSVCLTCYSWSAQTILFNGTCMGACPNGLFQTLSSGIAVCSPCLSLCTICSGFASNCSACQVGAYLFNLACYQSCPLATYTSPSNTCITCIHANCSVCSETTCTACFWPFLLYNGACSSTCPPLFYSNTGACVSCASNCLICSPTNGSCSSCVSPNLLYGGSCYLSCPSGVFQQQNNNICEACQSPCASCSITSTNCTSCLRVFNQISYFYFQNQCLSQCSDGYYGDATSAVCMQCPLGCATCKISACLSCNSAFFLFQGKCYTQCPSGTYQNSTACLSCSSICAACLSASVCTSCISSYSLFNSTCSLSCPDLYYSSGGICLPCAFPCKLCNSLGCYTCVSGYYLQQNSCTTSCSGILHPNNQTMVCQTCQRPCSECTWSSSCTSCFSDYYLLETSCLSSCPKGYYSNGAQCMLCALSCTSCTFLNNQPACTACATSLLLFSFTCIASCPSGTQQANGFCFSEDCSSLPHCAVCAGTQCTQCNSLYQMDSSFVCSQMVNGSAVANALMGIPVPFPFLIAILMVMVTAFLLKHNFPKMFAPLFIYSIAGCFELLCLALWTLLSVFWSLGLQQPLSYVSVVYAPVLIGSVYVLLNVIQFVLWNRRIKTDKQYRLWEKQDNRCASLSIAIVSLFFSFRLDALKFSKTGHNPHLSARLSSPQAFKHYSVLALLSLLLSAVSILVSVYISYMQTSLNYLFFTGIEVAVIAIIMIVLSVAMLCVSREQLLQDKTEYHVGYDSDQLQGKSVEQLLNGLGIVEEHHEYNRYEDSGNAVLMKNDYSSQKHSQDLTLMEPVAHLSFQEKDASQAELRSENPKETQTQGEGRESDDIFGQVEVSSDSHILIDGFQRDKKEAIELTNHYGLAEQPLSSTYPRQTGAIVKQKLTQLKDDSSEIESVGSFEQFTVDITRGKWKKQNVVKLAKEEEQAQGQYIQELQIKQIIEEKIKLEEAERRRQQEEAKRVKEIEQLLRKAEQQRQKWQAEQKREQQLKKRVQQLKLQQRIEYERRKREQFQQQKRRKAQERLQKIQQQKKREQQWRIKKQQTRLKKLQEQRLLNQRMEQLWKEEEELRQRMKQEQAKQKAKIQHDRRMQKERNKIELDKIIKLNTNLQLLEGMQQQFQAKNEQLEKQQRYLQFKQEERQREAKERGLMAVDDRLSRMAVVFEEMWKKAGQMGRKTQKKIMSQQEREVKTQRLTISYKNSDQNIVSQLSPRKIKVNPRPHPYQYTRMHLYVEEGTEILSHSESSPQVSEEQLQIAFQGGEGKIEEESAVEKPKSILRQHQTSKTDNDLKEKEEIKLKTAFAQTASKHEALRSAPHKEMPKEDTEQPITMIFQDKMAEVLQEEEEEEKGQTIQSNPSKAMTELREAKGDQIDIEYIGRSIHSGSSDTHWPIEPQMQERILEVQSRADRYISEPKRKQTQRYIYETPDNRIYEEQEDGETQLGEIVFEEADQILESGDSHRTALSRSFDKSSGRRKYPSGRVNRMVIDLSPGK